MEETMDPDELLKRILENCNEMQKLDAILETEGGLSERTCLLEKQAELGAEVSEQVQNLHEWIASGGFVPRLWAKEESGLGK
jgi:uncharacterized ParB-like nuclease family protein